jgi:hypothetical protein
MKKIILLILVLLPNITFAQSANTILVNEQTRTGRTGRAVPMIIESVTTCDQSGSGYVFTATGGIAEPGRAVANHTQYFDVFDTEADCNAVRAVYQEKALGRADYLKQATAHQKSSQTPTITDSSLGGLKPDLCKDGYCPLVSIPGLTTVGTPVKNPAAYVVGLYRLAIGVGGAVAVILLVYSGFMMMTTESPSVKTIQKDKLVDIAYGLGFLLGAYLILSLIDPRLVNINFDIGKALPQTGGAAGSNVRRAGQSPQAIEAARTQALQDTQTSYDTQIAAATAAGNSEEAARLTQERDNRLQDIRNRQYPALPDQSTTSSNTNAINNALATGQNPQAEIARVSADYNNRIQAEQDPIVRAQLTQERDNEIARLNAFTIGAQAEQAIATGNRQAAQQAAEALRTGRTQADSSNSSDSTNWTRAQYASTAQTLLQNCEANPNSCTPQTVATLREAAAPAGDNAIEAIAGASNDWSNYYRVYDDAATPEYWTYQYSERVGTTVVYKRSDKNNSEFLCNRSRSSLARRVTPTGPILSVDSQCVFGRVNP